MFLEYEFSNSAVLKFVLFYGCVLKNVLQVILALYSYFVDLLHRELVALLFIRVCYCFLCSYINRVLILALVK